MIDLTPRELDVTRCLLNGVIHDKTIAAELRIGPRTVKMHLSAIYWKFGIHDGNKRVKLVRALFARSQEISGQCSVASAQWPALATGHRPPATDN